MTRHKTSSRLLAMFLSLMLVLGMMPISVFATDGEVTYLAENGDEQTLEEAYTTINSGNAPTEWADGWYVVDGTVTIDNRVTVTGDVKLILKDGSDLTVNGGIFVPSGSTFTVYGQQNGTGNLTSIGTNGNAGIGGTGSDVNFGTIILAAKGKIVATGDTRAAGIGGGGRMNNGQPVDGTIHIYRGTIEATGGGWAAGIGGGADSKTDCAIIIDGGTVTAQGGLNNVGIGGTDGSKTIAINGGHIQAYGSGAGAGIGGSYNSSGGSITITGGVIEAGSIGGGSAENGGSGGTIVISGGVVTVERIGAGGNNAEGTFSTTASGNAVIFAGSITDQSDKDNWSGVIFEGNEGKIYGDSYTVEETLTIPADKTLTVETGKTLINNCTITNNGTIYIELGGIYNGEETSPNPVQYQKEQVSYLEYDNGSFINKYVEEYTLINKDNLLTAWTTGWYVVDGEVTISSRVTVTGDVKLILKDGANLTVNGGIVVPSGSTFTVYGQQNGTGNLTSIGTNGNAGIGGTGSYVNFGTIILAAKGKIVATGDTRAAGIGGGGLMDNGQPVDGTIHIYRGTIEATGGDWAAGIGGGADSITDCAIIIDGGTVTATGGEEGAGIGGGYGGSGGTITINSGMVDATSGNNAAGIGGGRDGASGSFATGTDGTAVIFASSITDQSGKENWKGLIFEENDGKIYGESYTVEEALTIPADKTLTIEDGKTLTVPDDIVITDNGTIKVNMGGSYDGDQPNGNPVQYQIDWDYDGDSVADDTTYVSYDEMPVHDDVIKEQTDKYYYEFTGWSPELKNVTGTAVYKAMFTEHLRRFDVTIPTGEGFTVKYEGNTNLEYGSDFNFTVNIVDGYSKTDAFVVEANGTVLSANDDGIYTVNVIEDTRITVNGVADIIAPTATITVNENTFKEFINKITFGILCNDKYDVTISAEDAGSGVNTIEYYVTETAISEDEIVNHGEWKAYDKAFSFNYDGKYVVYAKVTDNAGNTTFISSDGMILDKTAPTNVVVNTNGYESGQWTDETVELTVSGSEALSGIERYEYSTDGGNNWNVMTNESITISSETNGTEYVFRSLSKAGNYSQSSDAVVVTIDKQIPTISVTGDTNTIKQSDTVKITANAGLSGVAKVEVSKDGGEAQDITANYADGYVVTENGTYTFTVTNGAGVTATATITYDKLDQTKPEVLLNTHGYTSNEWTNSDVTLTVSDRYQPEGKVCVYVFAPNNSKRVYDYDTTDPALLINVAMLNGIRHTWNDADKVRIAKQQLAQVMYGGNETQKKGDFRFVVDDNAIYHTLGDFRSADARKKFQLLQQKEKDLDTMIDALDRVRTKYASGNQSTKGQLTPGILDQEKRVKELREEIDRLTLDIRNTEIRKLKNP